MSINKTSYVKERLHSFNGNKLHMYINPKSMKQDIQFLPIDILAYLSLLELPTCNDSLPMIQMDPL